MALIALRVDIVAQAAPVYRALITARAIAQAQAVAAAVVAVAAAVAAAEVHADNANIRRIFFEKQTQNRILL